MKEPNPLSIRETLRWSQRRMANYLGCSQPTVSRMEQKGQAIGPLKRLYEILQADMRRPVEAREPVEERLEAGA